MKNIEYNKIYLEDCIKAMENFPSDCIDLVFADPPYNLEKEYHTYSDDKHGNFYLAWSYKWLDELCRILKPNGSLFILNLPKWSIYYANFLDMRLYRQSCIVWDALSSPRGKIMPAHYTLLYYTKSPSNYTYNPISIKNGYDFCFNKKCKEEREKDPEVMKHPISDIWYDIPRIKHRKDRDNHPCQLPLRLLERIIYMSSNEKYVVFDPFLGVGTTAIVAKLMNRYYSGCEIDPSYYDICLDKIQNFEQYREQLINYPKRNHENLKIDSYF